MGYIINEYLIVECWKDEHLKSAHKQAKLMFGDKVTEIMPHQVNGSASFFVNTSGSKAGWSESSDHRDKIEGFFQWHSDQKENYCTIARVTVPEEPEHSKVTAV